MSELIKIIRNPKKAMKRALCRGFGSYREGVMAVDRASTIFMGIVWASFGITFLYIAVLVLSGLIEVARFIIPAVSVLLKDPHDSLNMIGIWLLDKVVNNVHVQNFLLTILLAILVVFVIPSKWYEQTAKRLASYLTKEAFVCDKLVHSSEVKAIYDSVRALPEEQQDEFEEGLGGLMRGLGRRYE